MKEGLWLVDKDDSRVASDDLRDYPGECFDAIACMINKQRLRMKVDCLFVDASLLHIVGRRAWRQASSKLTQMGGVEHEVNTERLKDDASDLMSLCVISK